MVVVVVITSSRVQGARGGGDHFIHQPSPDTHLAPSGGGMTESRRGSPPPLLPPPSSLSLNLFPQICRRGVGGSMGFPAVGGLEPLQTDRWIRPYLHLQPKHHPCWHPKEANLCIGFKRQNSHFSPPTLLQELKSSMYFQIGQYSPSTFILGSYPSLCW